MQLLVRNLESRTITYDVPEDCGVYALKQQLQAKEGIPSTSQGLVFAGRQLDDDARIIDYGITCGSTLQLVLRLRGGKGGFGALLRGQGRDGKITTNFDACRDLQGRRIRHSKSEQQLAEWQSQSKDRELEKVAMQHIKELAKQQRREAHDQVNVEEVAEEQMKSIKKVQDAVQSALASAAASSAVAGNKRKGKEAEGEAAVVKPATKKSKMLAFLEEIEDDDDESSEGGDE